MIAEVIDAQGTTDDFIGHPGRDNFVVITHSDDSQPLVNRLNERFSKEILQHYSFIDRERGYMLDGNEQRGLMALSIGTVSTRTHQFSDIREITELAAEDRRRKRSGDSSSESGSSDILTAW
jgi:GGDEF domain-containing protein